MVVGHEFCGQIVDTSAAATKFRIGQRVSGEGHIVCGICRNCRAGVAICAAIRKASALIAPEVTPSTCVSLT